MKVPTYDAPQVEARPLPGVRQESIASPSLFDGAAVQQQQLGQGVQRVGVELSEVAARIQDRDNLDAVNRAKTALQTDYTGYKDAVQKDRVGASARGVMKDTADWWDKKISEHADNLGNQAQKRAFGQLASQLRMQSVDGMSHYEVGQTREAVNESGKASIVGDINWAASQVGTPTEATAISYSKGRVLKQLDALAITNGYASDAPEAVAIRTAKRDEALTNLHMQVIQNMVNDPNGGASRAKGYFEANKKEVNGTSYDTIERLFKTGSAKEKAQTTSVQLFTQGKDETEGLAWIRDNLKGEEQEQASLEWRTRWQENKVAAERKQGQFGEKAWDTYNKTGRFSAIPADVLDGMDPKARAQLKEHAELKAQGKEVKTNFGSWYEVQQKILSGTPVNLLQYTASISSADLKGLATLQSKPDADLKDARTFQQQLESQHNVLGWSASDREKKGAFDKAAGDAVFAEEQKSGKKLNQAERQKVIDRMVIDGEVLSGHWYMNDPNKKYYEVYGTDDAAKFEPTVPKAERVKIEAALKKAGKRVDDATVLQLYKKKMGL